MHASPSRRKAAATRRRPWADLPPDLLRDISGRLRHTADNVRFHAVCRSWRRTSPLPLFRVASTPCDGLVLHSTVRRRTLWPVTSIASYSRDYVTFARFAGKNNWVASSDGTAAWLFTASPEPSLLDLDTRQVTSLPRFPDHEITRSSMEYSRGIVYGDGTVLLYSFVKDTTGCARPSTFTAAILRRGDTVWTIFKKKLHVIGNRCTGAAYHDGKVLLFVHVYKYYWRVLTPEDNEDDDEDYYEGGLLEPWMKADLENTYFRDSYILESHGELLWVTIFVDKKWRHVDADRDPTKALSVKVHMLQGTNKGTSNARWVPRDGRSLSDRIFFLGSPASFTADVTDPGGANGGCVYFVFDRCVLCYSLVDNEAKVVERLRPGWGSDYEHVWLRQ